MCQRSHTIKKPVQFICPFLCFFSFFHRHTLNEYYCLGHFQMYLNDITCLVLALALALLLTLSLSYGAVSHENQCSIVTLSNTRTTSEKTGRWTTHRWLYTAAALHPLSQARDPRSFILCVCVSFFFLPFISLTGHGQFKDKCLLDTRKNFLSYSCTHT